MTTRIAPIVELIAELRWQPDGLATAVSSAPFMQPMLANPGGAFEEFFMRFGVAATAAGHGEVERLVPSGFPLLPHHAVYRFKSKNNEGLATSIFQIGPGLLTINAIPPYGSWGEFREIVVKGIEAMLGTRADAHRDLPITAISIRYVDAFVDHHTGGRSVDAFLRDILGFGLTLPAGLAECLNAGADPKPVVQFQIPMSDARVMNIGIGEGLVNGRHAIMMDQSISKASEIAPAAEAIMAFMDPAQRAIHNSFVKITTPIHDTLPVAATKYVD